MTYGEVQPGDVYLTLFDEVFVLVCREPGRRLWLSLNHGRTQEVIVDEADEMMSKQIPPERLLYTAPRGER